MRTAIQGANGAYSVSTEGLFSANVNIYNQTVTITGRVVNGVPKVGTMLSYMDARMTEQTLINSYGLENLYNIRNSISPKYWNKYGIKP